jgi:hypothetical protein
MLFDDDHPAKMYNGTFGGFEEVAPLIQSEASLLVYGLVPPHEEPQMASGPKRPLPGSDGEKASEPRGRASAPAGKGKREDERKKEGKVAAARRGRPDEIAAKSTRPARRPVLQQLPPPARSPSEHRGRPTATRRPPQGSSRADRRRPQGTGRPGRHPSARWATWRS